MLHAPLLGPTFIEHHDLLGLSMDVALDLDAISRITTCILEEDQPRALKLALRLGRKLSDPSSIANDPFLEAIRLISLLYCQSIYSQIPLSNYSQIPEIQDYTLLGKLKAVPLARWTRIPGVWLWITIVASQVTQGRPEALLFRNWQFNCAMNLAMGSHYTALMECFERMLVVQRWVASGTVQAVVVSSQEVRTHSSVLEFMAASTYSTLHHHNHDCGHYFAEKHEYGHDP